MPTLKTVRTYAREALALIARDESRDHHGIQFYSTKTGADCPRVIFAGHGELAPDDWRYCWGVDILQAIAEGSEEIPGDTDVNEGDDLFSLIDDTEPECIYTAHLLGWLASNLTRYSYVEDAIEEAGDNLGKMETREGLKGFLAAIAWGMCAEWRECAGLVCSEILTVAQNIEAEAGQ